MLRNILRRAGIIKVRDHWIYTGNLRSGNIVLDLGANKGLFSKAMHESYGSCCYAVEPNPELYDGIDYEFITKLNSAVTSSNGPVDFYISDNAEASKSRSHRPSTFGGMGRIQEWIERENETAA